MIGSGAATSICQRRARTHKRRTAIAGSLYRAHCVASSAPVEGCDRGHSSVTREANFTLHILENTVYDFRSLVRARMRARSFANHIARQAPFRRRVNRRDAPEPGLRDLRNSAMPGREGIRRRAQQGGMERHRSVMRGASLRSAAAATSQDWGTKCTKERWTSAARRARTRLSWRNDRGGNQLPDRPRCSRPAGRACCSRWGSSSEQPRRMLPSPSTKPSRRRR